jgi:GT2 family glycosyltransferase
MITVVITSYNRFDLLYKTIESFNRINTYPIKEVILIDDSGNEEMYRRVKEAYHNYHLILNEVNIGLVESIDKAYSLVTTPYIFHTEDDFEYIKSGFIEACIKVMESDERILRVGIRGLTHTQLLDPTIQMAGEVPYRYPLYYAMDADSRRNQLWFGFGFQCGLIRKSHYDLVKPYSQHSTPQEFITIRECRIGIAYHALGLLAVSLTEDYVIHTGGQRSTYGLRMDG